MSLELEVTRDNWSVTRLGLLPFAPPPSNPEWEMYIYCVYIDRATAAWRGENRLSLKGSKHLLKINRENKAENRGKWVSSRFHQSQGCGRAGDRTGRKHRGVARRYTYHQKEKTGVNCTLMAFSLLKLDQSNVMYGKKSQLRYREWGASPHPRKLLKKIFHGRILRDYFNLNPKFKPIEILTM